jgi:hypothetical protein
MPPVAAVHEARVLRAATLWKVIAQAIVAKLVLTCHLLALIRCQLLELLAKPQLM